MGNTKSSPPSYKSIIDNDIEIKKKQLQLQENIEEEYEQKIKNEIMERTEQGFDYIIKLLFLQLFNDKIYESAMKKNIKIYTQDIPDNFLYNVLCKDNLVVFKKLYSMLDDKNEFITKKYSQPLNYYTLYENIIYLKAQKIGEFLEIKLKHTDISTYFIESILGNNYDPDGKYNPDGISGFKTLFNFVDDKKKVLCMNFFEKTLLQYLLEHKGETFIYDLDLISFTDTNFKIITDLNISKNVNNEMTTIAHIIFFKKYYSVINQIIEKRNDWLFHIDAYGVTPLNLLFMTRYCHTLTYTSQEENIIYNIFKNIGKSVFIKLFDIKTQKYLACETSISVGSSFLDILDITCKNKIFIEKISSIMIEE